jgi:hypothetical protein
MIKSTNSQRAEDSEDLTDERIKEIDTPIFDNYRKVLNKYKKYYSTNNSEIAMGMGFSRPTVLNFLGSENKQGTGEIALSRGRIMNLHTELTKPEKLKPKEEGKKLTESQERRIQLKEDGADELLIAAGLPPEKLQMVIVSPILKPQLTFISFLYEDQPLDSHLYYQIIKAQTDQSRFQQIGYNFKKLEENPDFLNYPQSKNPNKILEYVKENLAESQVGISLQSQLDRNIWLDGKIKYAVKKNYDSAVRLTEKNSLLPTESTALFKSVLNNELNKNERFELDLMVIGVERTSLSIPWSSETNSSDLLNEIDIIEKVCESKLRINSNKDSESQKETLESSEFKNLSDNNLCLLYPVTRTVVTCRYYKENNETIDFECVSTGTQLGTATSAIIQNMGFKHGMSKLEMSMNWLGKDIKSLVNTTVTITDSLGKTFSGEWVSVDLMQSFLQALKVAGNKWFYQNCLNKLVVNDYKIIIQKTAKLKADFYRLRYASDEFDIDNTVNDIKIFQEVSDRAVENITHIRELLPKKVQDTFLSTSYRINILCQLYMLHDANIEMNHQKCYELIEEIQDTLNKKIDKNGENVIIEDSFLVSAEVALFTEKIAYNLSFGIQYHNKLSQKLEASDLDKYSELNLLELTSIGIVDHFKKLDLEIEENIKKYNDKDPNKDPGYDIYHSLGSYHSIVGRILFYLGDKDALGEAFTRFLKAAWYFQRIGLIIKVQRSLILAGRIKVRLGDKKMVRQCINISESILNEAKTKVSILKNQDFLLSIDSRIQLLKAEESLIVGEINEDSIKLCLESLKGALKLGLSRHIMDVLYTGSIFSKSLGRRTVKEDLVLVFPEVFSDKEIPLKNQGRGKTPREKYRQLLKSSDNNQITIKVARELCNRIESLIKYQDGGKSTSWSDIAEGIKDFLIETWNELNTSATGNKDSKHPFSILIKDGDFLKSYD